MNQTAPDAASRAAEKIVHNYYLELPEDGPDGSMSKADMAAIIRAEYEPVIRELVDALRGLLNENSCPPDDRTGIESWEAAVKRAEAVLAKHLPPE